MSDSRPHRALVPGDTINYYCPAFVVGNPLGLRNAVVVSIKPGKERPVRINNLDVLTRATWIQVVEGRNGNKLEQPWLQVGYWNLVAGEFEVERQEHVLVRGVNAATTSAYAAVRKSLAPQGRKQAMNDRLDKAGSGSEKAAASRLGAGSDAGEESSSPPRNISPAQLQQFESVQTLAVRHAKHKRGRDPNGVRRLSRKARYKKMRKVTRDSRYVHHAKVAEHQELRQVMLLPHARAAIDNLRQKRKAELRRREERSKAADIEEEMKEEETKTCDSATGEVVQDVVPARGGDDPSAAAEPDSDSSTSDEEAIELTLSGVSGKSPIAWPHDVDRLQHQSNPHGVVFRQIDEYGMCECDSKDSCTQDLCLNARMGIFCDRGNCALHACCANFPREYTTLRLFQSETRGIGVYTKRAIPSDVVVAEYCGILEPYEGLCGRDDDALPLKHTTGHSLLLNTRAKDGRFVNIEAQKAGGMARFINHHCQPNCKLVEMQNRDLVTVVVITIQSIKAMDELTVQYHGKLWFNCACGSATCVSSADGSSRCDIRAYPRR